MRTPRMPIPAWIPAIAGLCLMALSAGCAPDVADIHAQNPSSAANCGTPCELAPRQVGTDTGWATLARGNGFKISAATKADGSLWIWGRNDFGQVGNGAPGADVPVPTQVLP